MMKNVSKNNKCDMDPESLPDKPKSVPGPKGYPLVGNLFQLEAGKVHQQTTDWIQDFGKIFRLNVLGKRLIFLNSSKLIRQAFARLGSTALDNRPKTFAGTYVCPNSIALSNNVDFSLKQKAVLIKVLVENLQTINAGTDNIAASFRRHVEQSINEETDGKETILKPALLDLITFQLIGEALSADDPDRDALWEFIDLLYVLIDPSVDGALRMFPFLRHLPGYYGNVYRQTIVTRDKVSKRFFEDQKATFQEGKIRGLVDVCIQKQREEVTKTGTTWLTDEYIKGLVFDTLAAGMTELMKTLRLFMLLMCHYPDVQARLHAEIDSIIGSERFPRAEDRNWMPYTSAVMLEIWRYGSQTPLAIPHLCNKDVIVDGYLIEVGSVIFPNLYGVHHDDEIWGDPWNFRPDRFLDKAGMLLPADHILIQNVIPFSLGKRACPGQDFARSQTFVSMTSLLQRVCILPPENSELPSADSRHYTKKFPLTEPEFQCRFVTRENIVI